MPVCTCTAAQGTLTQESKARPAPSAVEGGQVLPEPGYEKEWPARRGEA